MAGDQLVVGVALEPFGFLALVAGVDPVAGNEIVQVGSRQRILPRTKNPAMSLAGSATG